MSNVFIIGDCHLKATAPIARKDDYPNVILNKLVYLSNIAKGNKCKNFILLGDVFDSNTTSLPYLANVINAFKKIHDNGINVYTIVGNHDIKNNRMDSLESSALGILISTDLVKLAPRDLEIENTLFKCFNYPEDLESKSSDKYEVCVAHRYYNFDLAHDSLHKEDVEKLNYDAMVLGHYHVPCDNEVIGNTVLYRPGSLSRSTSEPYNKLRIPRVLVFNCKNHKTAYIEVECESAEDVFVEHIESNNQEAISMKDLIQFITTSYSSADMDVRSYFSNLEIPYNCREIIAKYLDSVGA